MRIFSPRKARRLLAITALLAIGMVLPGQESTAGAPGGGAGSRQGSFGIFIVITGPRANVQATVAPPRATTAGTLGHSYDPFQANFGVCGETSTPGLPHFQVSARLNGKRALPCWLTVGDAF